MACPGLYSECFTFTFFKQFCSSEKTNSRVAHWKYEYFISWGGLINGTSLLFRGFEFWNINVEERVGHSFNFEKWASVNVPVAVLFSLLLQAHSLL